MIRGDCNVFIDCLKLPCLKPIQSHDFIITSCCAVILVGEIRVWLVRNDSQSYKCFLLYIVRQRVHDQSDTCVHII